MAVYTLTISPAQAARVAAAYTGYYKYQSTIPDPVNPGQTIPNPEGVAAFVKRKIGEQMLAVVKEWEASPAGTAAVAAAVAKVDAEIVVT